MQRRTFLRGVGATLALRALPRGTYGYTLERARRVERIGIQLYTLRDAARADLRGTLTDIARIGFKEVELLDSMGNFGMPARDLRRLLDRLKLRAPSTHISTKALDDLPRLIGDAHTLGHGYVVVASLPLDPKQPSLDDYRRWADRLNAAGETVRRAGLWLGFHDEPENFAPIDGQVPYDVMVERLDPARVRLQLDTGNAAMGGRDPLPYMERWADRYWLFHIKDAPKLGAEHDAELGNGVVNIARILARAGSLKKKHVFIEQETYPGAPIDSVRKDYAYMKALRF
jgi:sugar phosphate isomerase/epimerase